MKFTLFFLFLTITSLAKGQAIDVSKICFDGFYRTEAKVDNANNDTSYHYLRFYATGAVISVTSEGTPNDLKRWFNLSHDDVSVGSYNMKGKRLYFTTKSKNGSVIYKGKIANQYCLILKSKSLINGHRARNKYYFIAVPDLN